MIFDLWDTLTEPVAPAERGRHAWEVGEILGAGGEAFAALVAATFAERCRGELGDLRATLRILCRRLGVEPAPATLEAAAAHRMEAQSGLLQFRDDAVPVVERFRRHGWRIGLLTDSTCETETLWEGLELRHLFDAAVFSCAESRSKPDPSFHDVVLRGLGVVPADCLYVADGRSGELAGATRLGMRCVQLHLEAATPGAEDWPGEKVSSLTAIADPWSPLDHPAASMFNSGQRRRRKEGCTWTTSCSPTSTTHCRPGCIPAAAEARRRRRLHSGHSTGGTKNERRPPGR